MSSENLKVMVRQLREGLGKTQTEFGALIGKGLATVQRYEALVPPKGKVLVALEKLARKNGFTEYADAFKGALIAELGMGQSSDEWPGPFCRTGGVVIVGPETPEEQNTIAAVCRIMREAKWPGPRGESARKEKKSIDRATLRLRRENLDIGRDKPEEMRAAAMIRLHRDGMQPDAIARRLKASIEDVKAILAYDEGESEK